MLTVRHGLKQRQFKSGSRMRQWKANRIAVQQLHTSDSAHLSISLVSDENEHTAADQRSAVDLEVAQFAHDGQVESVFGLTPHL